MMKHKQNPDSLSYRDAGVDIDAGQQLVEHIKPLAKQTHRPGVLTGLGGFGALFELPLADYKQPVLVSGTDGVGTKLKLAIECNKHDTIGIDLVAMCVNDLLVSGSDPLFFLDYYASGKLQLETAKSIMNGIAEGCKLAGTALIGGETAEMPGLYNARDYDLAGFAVGIVEKAKILDGSKVTAGDCLIGLASSGPHSNGYSLIRHILQTRQLSLETKLAGKSLADHLLEPTLIYVKTIKALLANNTVHALAHITGGGILENLPRVLPSHCQAQIDTQSWPQPVIFDWLQQQGNITTKEMFRTFNCGVGMILCVPENEVQPCLSLLNTMQETAWPIGVITDRGTGDEAVILQ